MTTLQPDHVEAATVRGWLDRPDAVTVLDVRTPAEFETALTDTCTMGRLLSALPYNRAPRDRTAAEVLAQLPTTPLPATQLPATQLLAGEPQP